MGGHRFVGMCAQVRTPMRASERLVRACYVRAGARKRKGREGDEGSGPGGCVQCREYQLLVQELDFLLAIIRRLRRPFGRHRTAWPMMRKHTRLVYECERCNPVQPQPVSQRRGDPSHASGSGQSGGFWILTSTSTYDNRRGVGTTTMQPRCVHTCFVRVPQRANAKALCAGCCA